MTEEQKVEISLLTKTHMERLGLDPKSPKDCTTYVDKLSADLRKTK